MPRGIVLFIATNAGMIGVSRLTYAFGAMLSFTIAHLAVIALRIEQPDRTRPYRGPGTVRVLGRELPLFAVVGGLGTASSWVVVTALNFETLVAGTIWLALGLTTYVLYRRHQGLSLTETHKIVLPKPAVEHEVEYESILVAFEDAQYSPEAVTTAVRLAARRRRGIYVLVTITVPPNLPSTLTPQSGRPAPQALSTRRT